MSDNNTSINEKAVILFEMLDIDSSKIRKTGNIKGYSDNKELKNY